MKTKKYDKNLVFVNKNEAKREVTMPVMIPGCKDCDFKRGEKVFTVDEVAKMCRDYNEKFRLVDKMHVYGSTGQLVGKSVENWTTKKDETLKNLMDYEVTLPAGTWMTTIKVTDDESWEQVDNGTLKGASGTYLSEDNANKLLEILSANKSNSEFDESYIDMVTAMKRVLIADLDKPVPVTISLVDSPCVYDAIATSKKSGVATKIGKTLSKVNVKLVKQAVDSLNEILAIATNQDESDAKDAIVNKEADTIFEDTLIEITDCVKSATKAIQMIPGDTLDDAIANDMSNLMNTAAAFISGFETLCGDICDDQINDLKSMAMNG